jgi:hypothetical protein
MTDRQKLAALLDSFGVEYINEKNYIVFEEGKAGVTGYTGFYTKFEFDTDGRFITVGAYE